MAKKEFTENTNQELGTTELGLPKEQIEEIDQRQNLSPTEEIENTKKIETQKNEQYLDAAKSANALPGIYIQRAIAYSQEGLYEQAIVELSASYSSETRYGCSIQSIGEYPTKNGQW